MDFTPSPRAAELAERVKAFVRDEVIPLEPRATHADGLPPDLLAELRLKARAAGLFGPQLPADGTTPRPRPVALRSLWWQRELSPRHPTFQTSGRGINRRAPPPFS